MRMKKTILLLACAALFMACQESLEERAAREAREVTENKCPMLVNTDLMLDSIVFDIPTLTQTQYFRFFGESDHDSLRIDPYNAKSQLVDELKSAPSYKPLLERGIAFRYIYRSTKDPEKVYLDVLLTQKDYQ